MKLKNEKPGEYVKYDVELSKEEYNFLYNLGLQNIQKDPAALVEYAMISILEEYIKKLDIEEVSTGRDIIKETDVVILLED